MITPRFPTHSDNCDWMITPKQRLENLETSCFVIFFFARFVCRLMILEMQWSERKRVYQKPLVVFDCLSHQFFSIDRSCRSWCQRVRQDENGVVTFEEFKNVLRDFNLSGSSHPELEGAGKAAEIFHSVDLDGRGVIDYTEFVAACLDHKVEQEESVSWLCGKTSESKPLGGTH